MATEEIYTNVASGTDLSFDYVAFTVVAAVIAGVRREGGTGGREGYTVCPSPTK